MSVDYTDSVMVRFTSDQWNALDILAEAEGLSRATYIRLCVFNKRPHFKSTEHKELFERVRYQGEELLSMTGAVKVTDFQKKIIRELAKDAGHRTLASYMRTCVFKSVPKPKDSSLEVKRIRAGRFEKRPMNPVELRRLGRVLQGATAVRADKKRLSITLKLTEEDWDYLADFYRWEELKE